VQFVPGAVVLVGAGVLVFTVMFVVFVLFVVFVVFVPPVARATASKQAFSAKRSMPFHLQTMRSFPPKKSTSTKKAPDLRTRFAKLARTRIQICGWIFWKEKHFQLVKKKN
jgi:hypothetical protein